MTSFLSIAKKVDAVPYPHERDFIHFFNNVYTLKSHDDTFNLGYILKPIYEELAKFPQYFEANDSNRTIKLSITLDTALKRECALEEIGKSWSKQPLFDTLKGWRNEKYTIYDDKQCVYFRLERAMCPLLGVVMYGVHINGYVVGSDDKIKLWVPRRAANKPTYPGMLDNTVAGGLGYPYGPLETCYKECYEEAGLKEEYVAQHIKSAGVVSYLYQLKPNDFESEMGLIQPEVEYVYDLQMQSGVKPYPVDHESEDFQLLSLDEVKLRILNGEFKDNCAAIIVDFMIRQNLITPESEPNFIEINNRLHRFLPFPVKNN